MHEVLTHSTTRFDVEIKTSTVDVKQDGLTYKEAMDLFTETIKNNPQDKWLQQNYQQVLNGFGFCSTAQYGFNIEVSAYKFKGRQEPIQGSEHTCPARMMQVKNQDHWEMRGDDKCCSYCGSIHPDRVMELIKEYGFAIIDFNANKGKGYINRKDIPNASFGGIKFYTYHFTEDHVAQYNDLLTKYREGKL